MPVYLDFARVMKLRGSVKRHVQVRKRGQGGQCADDLRVMEGDEGFCRVMRRVESHGLKGGQRRGLERRWRKERPRAMELC